MKIRLGIKKIQYQGFGKSKPRFNAILPMLECNNEIICGILEVLFEGADFGL